MSTNKLRLGPIPKPEMVRMTIVLTSTLKAEIDRYAALHAQTWGEPVDAAGIVPHIVEAFIARDRGFKKLVSLKLFKWKSCRASNK